MVAGGTHRGEGDPPRRADAQRNRAAIIEAAGEILHRDGAQASLEEIARRAGVGSATLHRHFPGQRALLEAVFDAHVEQMCADASTIAQTCSGSDGLWVWLHQIAHHCAAEKALAVLLRNTNGGNETQNRSLGMLARAGLPLLDRATAAGTVRPGVRIEDLLVLVNAVADVCSGDAAGIDRLLDLTWNGARCQETP